MLEILCLEETYYYDNAGQTYYCPALSFTVDELKSLRIHTRGSDKYRLCTLLYKSGIFQSFENTFAGFVMPDFLQIQ